MKSILVFGILIGSAASFAADFGPGYVRPSVCSATTGNGNVVSVCLAQIDDFNGKYLKLTVLRPDDETGRPTQFLYSIKETMAPSGKTAASLEAVKYGVVGRFNKARQFLAAVHERSVGQITYRNGTGVVERIEITVKGIGKITATHFSVVAAPQ